MIIKLNILIFTAVSAWMDLRWRKVKNVWILAWLLPGLVFQASPYARTGMADGLTGLFLPILLLGWLFLLRKMGAGDIKLFSVIGLWTGSEVLLRFLLASMLCGAGYAAFLLVRKKDPHAVRTSRIPVAVCAFASAVCWIGGVYN